MSPRDGVRATPAVRAGPFGPVVTGPPDCCFDRAARKDFRFTTVVFARIVEQMCSFHSFRPVRFLSYLTQRRHAAGREEFLWRSLGGSLFIVGRTSLKLRSLLNHDVRGELK